MSRMRHAVHRAAICGNTPRVALYPGIGEVIVEVAVEDFMPLPWKREPKGVAVVIEGDSHRLTTTTRSQPAPGNHRWNANTRLSSSDGYTVTGSERSAG
jgi:hypothetical protein